METVCSRWEMEASVIQGGTVFQDTASCYEASLEVTYGIPPSVPLAI